MSSYCIAKRPTPMLNTPDFQKVFGSKDLPLDEKGLLRALEMIALPGTKFQILEKIGLHPAPVKIMDFDRAKASGFNCFSEDCIYSILPSEKQLNRESFRVGQNSQFWPERGIYSLKVTTKDYPDPVYIDSRFVEPAPVDTPERPKVLPSPDLIIDRLKSALGLPYVWGGNCHQGIPEILSLYQPPNPTNLHTLAGLDCSGLLYEATAGYTPRNTSELLKFGDEISSIEKINPLDILVYPGHVIIILDQTTTIESRYGHGVVLANLSNRLSELKSTKFLIRRFLSMKNS